MISTVAIALLLGLLERRVHRRGGHVAVDGDLDHLLAHHADQFAGRLVGDQLAVVDDRDPVAQLLGFLEVVRGQHHRHALAVELGDQLPQLAAQLDVDAGGRLVEHQDRRRVDHRLGDQQPPLHPARQRAGIGVALVRQAHRLEQLLRPAQRLGHAVEPGLVLEHLERGEERIEHDFLRDDADRALGVARVRVDVEAPDLGGAAGLHHQPGEDVDQRRLARAVGAEQAEDLRPAGTSKLTPFERQLALFALDAGVALDEVADADRGGLWSWRGALGPLRARSQCRYRRGS